LANDGRDARAELRPGRLRSLRRMPPACLLRVGAGFAHLLNFRPLQLISQFADSDKVLIESNHHIAPGVDICFKARECQVGCKSRLRVNGSDAGQTLLGLHQWN
jgi:hypothetical protein